MHPAFLRLFLMLLLFTGTLVSCRQKADEEKVADLNKAELPESEVQLKALNARIRQNPTDAAALEQRARVYLDQNKTQEALADINKAISLDSTKGPYFYTKARVLRSANQIPSAIVAGLKAEQKGVSDANLFLSIGEMFLIMKQYQRAIDYLNKSLKEGQFNEQAYYYKGLVYAESKDTARAISSFQTAVEQNPQYMDAYNSLIKIYNAKKDYKMARQYIASGLRFGPQDPVLWYNRGVTLQTTGQPDSAAASYRKALELKPGFSQASYNLGLIEYQQNDCEAALPLLQAVYDSPDLSAPNTERMLAECYEKTNQLDKAVTYYRKAAELAPGDQKLQAALSRTEAEARKGTSR